MYVVEYSVRSAYNTTLVEWSNGPYTALLHDEIHGWVAERSMWQTEGSMCGIQLGYAIIVLGGSN